MFFFGVWFELTLFKCDHDEQEACEEQKVDMDVIVTDKDVSLSAVCWILQSVVKASTNVDMFGAFGFGDGLSLARATARRLLAPLGLSRPAFIFFRRQRSPKSKVQSYH